MKDYFLILLSMFLCSIAVSQEYKTDYDKAVAFQDQLRFSEAAELYSGLIEEEPLDWLLWGNRAICYGAQGEVVKAEKDFKVAISLVPEEPSLNLAVANFYASEGKTEMAISYFQNAQKYNAEIDADSYFNYGSTYFIMGVKDSAILYLGMSWELDSTNSGVANNLGWVHLDTEPEKSCTYFNEAYMMDSTSAANVNNLGYSHMLCGNLETAYEYFEKAEKIDPENSFVFRNYGLYYMYKGEKELAKQNLQKALDLNIVEEWGESYISELRTYCDKE